MRGPVAGLMLCAVMGGSMAHAQVIDPSQYERLLLPVLMARTPGMFGSEWLSSFVVYNGADTPAAFYPIDCQLSVCPADEAFYIPPGTAGTPTTYFAAPGQAPGVLFYVKNDVFPRVSFALRVKDLSRQGQAEGTEITVVRESRVRTGKMQLLDVPTDGRFRVALRVYDLDATGESAVVARIFDQGLGSLLAQREMSLPVGQMATPPTRPGYAQILDLAQAFPQLASHAKVRVEIEPLTFGLRYWAYISVANNDTQFVTTITEQ